MARATPPSVRLQIGYGLVQHPSTLAKCHNVSKCSVRLTKCFLAELWSQQQIKWLAKLVDLCEATPPDAASVLLKYDETKQLVNMRLLKEASAASQSNHWATLVSTITFLCMTDQRAP